MSEQNNKREKFPKQIKLDGLWQWETRVCQHRQIDRQTEGQIDIQIDGKTIHIL